ncbi:hypothetical protein G7Z17_g12496 [Cylindrodendrum hubeiense]|uniref:DUF7514 domain-containing protein n=1 Tax=Cylindrodendrum hubeiense TaxID=595255 RepID=A0A9P5GYX0_9HYPO|nr:hypothetical protein G7Z17_g12496 [Cylindrodendrum hubeiense]
MQHTNEQGPWSHEAMSDVDKTPTAGPFGGEGSASSVSGTSESQGSVASKRMSSASDISKQQVEEIARGVFVDEKSRWFDEILVKVKTEREYNSPPMMDWRLMLGAVVGNPQMALSDASDTPSTEAGPSPRSMSIEMSTSSQKGAYQATVEDEADDRDDCAESGSRAHDSTRGSLSNNGSTYSPTSSLVSETTSSKVSGFSSSRKPSALGPPSLESPCPSPKTRPTVRFSDRGPVILHGRPKPMPPRLELPDANANDAALSAVDKKWGKLFDDKGEPTARLGQFLRGIANFLIAEYSPTNSLVVTPDKLHAFYSRYKLDSESLPFQHMFDSRHRKDFAGLEWLYQDLHCSYHLVQSRPNSTPRIPALTPSGFENWMVRLIQAFPEQEARRLSYIVAELPIAADGPLQDGKAERLPKQLSRHLLPASRHREVHEIVTTAAHSWIKSVGFVELSTRKDSRAEEGSRSSRSREENSGRRRSDENRSEGSSSRHHPKSRDSYSKSGDRGSSRKDPSGRFVPRANSEGSVRRSEPSPPRGDSHKSRSPTSNNRYRSSVSSLNSANTPEDYGLSSPSHQSSSSSSHFPRVTTSSGERRNREQEYRFYQGRAPGDATPRTVMGGGGNSRRQSLLVDTNQPREEVGPTYEEYSRTSPRVARSNVGAEDGGPYRPAHSGGAG